jgi:hypothetical protein
MDGKALPCDDGKVVGSGGDGRAVKATCASMAAFTSAHACGASCCTPARAAKSAELVVVAGVLEGPVDGGRSRLLSKRGVLLLTAMVPLGGAGHGGCGINRGTGLGRRWMGAVFAAGPQEQPTSAGVPRARGGEQGGPARAGLLVLGVLAEGAAAGSALLGRCRQASPAGQHGPAHLQLPPLA